MSDIRAKASEAKRLKRDEAFTQFLQDVRDAQIQTFTSSTADEIERREEAHAILRALNEIEQHLDAAIGDETLFNRNQ